MVSHSIDLASTEWETNPYQASPNDPLKPGKDAHTIDRHVGLGPDRLRSRVRDQGVDASAFPDLPVAQKSLQAALNDPDNLQKIQNWMNDQRDKVADGTFSPVSSPRLGVFTVKDANGANAVTGSSVSQSAFAAQDSQAQPTQVHSVKLVLAYSPESGTFYVRTAYPYPP
ncbi:RNase A-like domain-containing protein [Streptomyces sp. NPDC004284]|uniref:RNase A-like domain-containing protein n=1 Tax=Streptomyces sp. NPDC004284 TaxID=3364695 RepID=UPI003676CB9E